MPEAALDARDAGDAVRRPASCAEIFRVFTRLALQGFGGVLPIAQRELVERERWLTQAQFVELLALAQVLPGPNVVNLALIFGDRHFGLRGAIAAAAGMLAAPLLIVLAAAALYASHADDPRVAGALRGMGVVAAGLVVATALKMGTALGAALGRRTALSIAALVFAIVVGLRWPMLWVVFGVGAPAVALAWWRLR